jgi:nucleotide-binding universal stress UspA family protein
MIRTILVPLDGSAFSERALPVSKELARALHARLVLVCVADAGTALGRNLTDEDRQAISGKYANVHEEDTVLSTDIHMVEHAQEQIRAVAEAERYLQITLAQNAEPDIQVETAVPYGAAAEGIMTEIGIHSADLVIMSAHGQSGVNRLIGGSVTQAVLACSPVPVMVIPPKRE